ncbi:alpha/beta hydrolase family protein [Emticicia sp. BO119]|uniref:alpha/beta hydrolase n=1 Tax=Emticicia sp. BO119 TaxID=2757768 RepID=UPI0015EFE507|nr:alpha/beta hydrolase-fold protein [Emticicia sp. BO119]MBA4849568.1 alpha/beta hydrolase [Emticicia sp. BO119]
MSNFFTIEISDPIYEFDNLRWVTVKSNALKKRADVSVFIPKGVVPQDIKGIVILLHGVYGSHWAWSLKGGVHRITQKLIDDFKIQPMLLIMPSDGLFGDGSGYLSHHTENYEQWIVEDLKNLIHEIQSDLKPDLPFFITGLSMGGFGAMRLGAKYPQVFKSFSGLSSITEFSQLRQFLENNDDSVLKENVLAEENTLQWILAHKSQLPLFRFDCGKDDLLVEPNRKLHQELESNGIPHIYEEYEGSHDWPYWQGHITDTLLFFSKFIE